MSVSACAGAPANLSAPAPAAVGETTTPPPPRQAALPPADRPAEPPRPRLQPDRMLGLPAASLTALLGDPRLKRREPPAQVWQYPAKDCVLHVFLYRQRGADGYRVHHIEAWQRRARARDDGVCLNRVRERRLAADRES